MFKDRIYLTIALVAVVLALGFAAWFYWGRPGPGTAREVPCKWDADNLGGKADTCDGQCAPLYFGGVTNDGGIIDGKRIHVCCSQGYMPHPVKDPRTGAVIDWVCLKEVK